MIRDAATHAALPACVKRSQASEAPGLLRRLTVHSTSPVATMAAPSMLLKKYSQRKAGSA